MICEQLAPVNGVELSGFVPDLTSIYTNSCFAICPLIGGTGQQVKIVDIVFAFNNAELISLLK